MTPRLGTRRSNISSRAWSPVQSVLKLSNLPDTITTTQLRQILSYVRPYFSESGALQKVPSGITMIQIYPVDQFSVKPKSEKGFINSTLHDSVHSLRDTVNSSPVGPSAPDTELSSSSSSSATLSDDQLWQTPDLITSTNDGVIHLAQTATRPECIEPEQTSIAYIHFSSIGYLGQAENILKQVTINGKRIKVRYKWWNSAPLFRVWAKMRSGK